MTLPSYHRQKYRPAFCIKAISFFGNSIGGSDYRSSKDIEGTIPEMFEQAMDFFSANLHSVQAGQNFNSTGKLEVSKIALGNL
jgi:predicted HTH transcriptional regulator